MECKWAESLRTKRISGYFPGDRCRYILRTGDKDAGGQLDLELDGYYQYWNYAVKKGYSGTAVFTKQEPIGGHIRIGIEEHDQEGRVITYEFEDFYFVTVYTPNSQNELEAAGLPDALGRRFPGVFESAG